jgi:DNA-binding NarL/FixJ family response regulator
MTPIRVMLADDQPVVRAGFRVMLELTDDLTVVGEASDGGQAIELARASRPDIILMDVRMPHLDGIEATRAITSDPDLAGVRVVVLTTFEVDEYVFGALRAGASGFLLKDIDAHELHHAVRTVARGHALLAPAITRQVVERFTRGGDLPIEPDRLDALTARERDAVRLAAYGLTNEEIARHLIISPLTAKTHLNRAMTKLHARDRAQLVIIAYETGLARVGERLRPAPR